VERVAANVELKRGGDCRTVPAVLTDRSRAYPHYNARDGPARSPPFCACARRFGGVSSRLHWWSRMSRAFTKESDASGDEPDHAAEEAEHAHLVGVKNYITPSGLQRLKDERRFLLTRERRAVTEVVAWAASNGDRSENADYQYGKRRLRAIDRRIRFLTKRIDAAEVVDPEAPRGGRAATQIFFGATVRYANAAGTERAVSIVGVDEVDLDRHHISWMSPLARALMRSGPGDRVVLRAPGTTEQLEILDVRYERILVEPFSEPPGAEAATKTRPRTGG
jgi:transcription elongation factor GreB